MKKFFFLSSRLANEKEETNEKEQFFLRNGSLLLERLISICHGKHNPIRNFSAKDLKRATNRYSTSLIFHKGEHCEWYKGSLEGRPVSVLKIREHIQILEEFLPPYRCENIHESSINQIAMSIKMSNHSSVLKLLGCSLETQIPTLVYEYPPNECLIDRIRLSGSTHTQPLTWKIRLKIAFEIAHLISYLHTAFPRPIIHRDINLSDIFLDQHFVPKLSQFLLSVILPEGETQIQVQNLEGTLLNLAPEYASSGIVKESIDVYSFGNILFFLLSGKMHYEYGKAIIYLSETHEIERIMDPEILEVADTHERQQFQAVLYLACRCKSHNAEDRPTSTEVAKELRRIQGGLSENDYESNKQFWEKVDNVIGLNNSSGLINSSYIDDIGGNPDCSCASLSFSSLPSPR